MNRDHLADWRPPANGRAIRTIDAHAGGEPLRIVVDHLDMPGTTMAEKRRFAQAHYDGLRTTLMWEPRGHADMYGCLITEPTTPENEFGVLFLHNKGWSTMCGHGILAVTTVLLETGAIEPVQPETVLRIDTPVGPVTATASIDGDRVHEVRFVNVPAYVVDLDATVEIPGIGSVRYDLAFGGAYYAYVDAARFGFRCVPDEAVRLIDVGARIQRAVAAQVDIVHPLDRSLGFLYGTIFVGAPLGTGADSRNVCIFADGELDRSPTGTGVSGRVAIHHARGELDIGSSHIVESIVGSRFAGRAVESVTFAGFDAVLPEIAGTAHLTGTHRFFIDPTDDLARGFLVR